MAKTRKAKETKVTYTPRARRTTRVPRSNGARVASTPPRAKPVLPERRVLGKYIVADPKICHGKVTFIGTRIFVSDVIEMVAEARPWDDIIRQCHGSISNEAIAEAVQLAHEAFLRYIDKPDSEPLSL